jgi:hypothetical protein
LGSYGGADGSIFLFDEATERDENNGLQNITALLGNLAIQHTLGVADMFQFAAAHAVVTCPLGPRMRTWVGRKDATRAAPTGLLPAAEGPGSDSATLTALFADKHIPAFDMVALVGAHTVSQQRFYNQSRAGSPQDSTPGIWDTDFYAETSVAKDPFNPNVETFDSDYNISQDAALLAEFGGYAASQNDWVEHFSRAYLRLSLTGVNNINDLTECKHTPFPRKITLLMVSRHEGPTRVCAVFLQRF